MMDCALSIRADHQIHKSNPTPIKRIKRIKQVQPDEKYMLSAFQYEADSFHLTPSMTDELNDLIILLIDQPYLQIQIIGHTNTLPSHRYCDRLSLDRVLEIQKYLISKGIPRDRVKNNSSREKIPIDFIEKTRSKSTG